MNRLFLLLSFLFVSALAHGQGFRPEGMEPVAEGILPLGPTELLSVLPSAPEGWDLKISRASSEVGVWYSTRAERIFEGPVPEEGGPPPSFSMELIDTAGEGMGASLFENFTEGQEIGGEKQILIDGMPAFHRKTDRTESLSVFLLDRFVLNLFLRPVSGRRTTKDWLEEISLALLEEKAKKSPAGKMTSVVRIETVDEIEPERSSSYLLTVTREPTEADTARVLDALQRRSEGE